MDLTDFDASDPCTWTFPLTKEQKSILLAAPPVQVKLSKYPKFGKVAFNPAHYNARESNGSREWLMYSKSSNSLFCFCCCIFPVSPPRISPWNMFGKGSVGFHAFAHQSERIVNHEKSDHHFMCLISWKEFLKRIQNRKTLDNVAQNSLKRKCLFIKWFYVDYSMQSFIWRRIILHCLENRRKLGRQTVETFCR